MADMSGETEPSKGRSDAMKAFIVGNHYLPCTVPLQDLQPMELADLRMDVHHRGRVLTVKRIAKGRRACHALLDCRAGGIIWSNRAPGDVLAQVKEW